VLRPTGFPFLVAAIGLTGFSSVVYNISQVSFRQAIYQAYYVTRPEVPVEVLGRVLPKPDGGAMATINDDGSIDAKQGWWRGVPGTLRISGRRLDGPARPLRADVPSGYGRTGFNPAGLTFPRTGCWKVTATAGEHVLEFITKVWPRP